MRSVGDSHPYKPSFPVRENSEVVIIYPKMCKIDHFKMFMGFPQIFDMLVYSSTGEKDKKQGTYRDQPKTRGFIVGSNSMLKLLPSGNLTWPWLLNMAY